MTDIRAKSWVWALAIALATTFSNVSAQTAPAAKSAPSAVAEAARGAGSHAPTVDEMRLWSFGDCGTRFPYADSPQFKECAEIVGADAARDARAHHFCETSHAKDRAEALRCKSAYDENKKKAEQERILLQTPAASQAPLPDEVIQRVRSIAVVGVAQDRAAAGAEGAETPPPAPETTAQGGLPPNTALLAVAGTPHPGDKPSETRFSTTFVMGVMSIALLFAALFVRMRAGAKRRKDPNSMQY